METATLYELNEHLRRVIALNFEEPLWIRCEIGQVKESRGHYYFELVEKEPDGDTIRAQSSAVLWRSTHRTLSRKLGPVLNEILIDGVEVRINVRVDFHERYGLKLILEDVDPGFTMGNLEMQRREILETLHRENLIGCNARIPLPAVAQRIAILSNARAAGYHDFLNHLHENPYSYRFALDLYPVALQGNRVAREVTGALEEIGRVHTLYDCVIIIRGGGSRMDLAAFDNLDIGRAIATCPLPVITGIGHEIDKTVADVVAHAAVKTPTAAADLLVEVNAHFEGTVIRLLDRIAQHTQQRVALARQELKTSTVAMQYLPRQLLKTHRGWLEEVVPRIILGARNNLRTQKQQLAHLQDMMDALRPERILKRGYSITRMDGHIVKNASGLKSGDKLETQFSSGKISSTVE